MNKAAKILGLLSGLYSKYGDVAFKIYDVAKEFQAHNWKEALTGSFAVAGEIAGFFGTASISTLAPLGVMGIRKLAEHVEATGGTWTPEMIVAKAKELQAKDDALDSKFEPLPADDEEV